MVALVIGKIPFTPQHVNGACQNRLEMHTAKVARHRADIRRLRIIEISSSQTSKYEILSSSNNLF
jgi:hypothetical protein